MSSAINRTPQRTLAEDEFRPISFSEGRRGWLLAPWTRSARISPAENAVGHGDIEALVRQPNSCAPALRIDDRPALQHKAARRGRRSAEGDGDRPKLRMLRIAGANDQLLRIVLHHAGDPRQVHLRVEQDGEWRIADRPARHLLHFIIDHGQRLAVTDHQQRIALAILKANLAGPLQGQGPWDDAALAVGLLE